MVRNIIFEKFMFSRVGHDFEYSEGIISKLMEGLDFKYDGLESDLTSLEDFYKKDSQNIGKPGYDGKSKMLFKTEFLKD